jgi:2-phosphoglycerate kinase
MKRSQEVKHMVQPMTSPPFGWKILAIGGSSGTGKTLAALQVAKRFGVSAMLVDDIRLALQQMTTPKEHPGLHFFSSWEQRGRWEETPEYMRDGFITVGKAIAPALETIMAHHIVVAGVGPLVLEGDGILPQTVAHPRFSELKRFYGLTLTNEVRAVFLHESDQQTILQSMLARGRAFQDLPSEQQYQLAQASWLYGEWLRQEAGNYHLPVIASRPWDTLIERILEVIA